MLDNLSTRINSPEDFVKLTQLLYDKIILKAEFSELITYDACMFGLYHAYHEYLYLIFTENKLHEVSDHHRQLLNDLILWFEHHESTICQIIDSYDHTNMLKWLDIHRNLNSHGILTSAN